LGLGGALTRFPRPRVAGSVAADASGLLGAPAAASGSTEPVAAAWVAVRFLPLGRAISLGC